MAEIKVELKINATQDKIWEVISDLDNEPKFWKGTKETKTISKNGNEVEREIIIAFRDSKCKQKITIIPKNKIIAQFTEGIIKGSKTIELISDEPVVIMKTTWEIKMTGMMNMFTGMIKKHIRNGTEQAMQSIKQVVES